MLCITIVMEIVFGSASWNPINILRSGVAGRCILAVGLEGARPHTSTHDHARVVDKTAAIFVWGSGTSGATL